MTHATDGSNGGGDGRDLTAAVTTARRGLRRDVAVLVDSLEAGELFVPLARPIAGVPYGEHVELENELSMAPHMLVDSEQKVYAALFTRADLLEAAGDQLGWTTDEGPLEYCSLPARVALSMALEVIDEVNVVGLVINAIDSSELFLQRNELGSICAGQPLPLVGYVREIPVGDDERTLVAEPGDPPPPELIAAIEQCVAAEPELTSYVLERTFNPERDVEPHPTLRLRTTGAVDRPGITARLIAAIEDKLPPPGYVDIVFDEEPD
jgi:type III secretion system (T3SS) SseB-like protein